MAYDPLTDDAPPKIFRKFTYHSDGSDVGSAKATPRRDIKNPIALSTPLAVSERFGAFDMRETIPQVINDQLKMILLTNKGERPGNHKFGADVRAIIFESNLDDIEDTLARSIQENVTEFMGSIRLLDMSVFTSDQITELNTNEAMVRVSFAADGFSLTSKVELVVSAT